MRLLHLRLFLRSLLFLLAVTFLGKAAFAVYHRELFTALSLPQQAAALLWGLRFDLAVAATFALLAFLVAHRIYGVAYNGHAVVGMADGTGLLQTADKGYADYSVQGSPD